MKANSNLSTRLLPATALALLLAACGGGGGSSPPDVSPNAFSFSPAQVNDAVAGGSYTATATVAGFEGELTARIADTTGNAVAFLEVPGTDGVDESTVSAGDTLTLEIILGGANPPGSTASATVTLGEGNDAKSATFSVVVGESVDNEAPGIAIDFPTPLSTTHGETITLTGRWTDNDAVTSLALIHNGGQIVALPPHVIFPDGTWQMTVPLTAGGNNIQIAGTDPSGNESPGAIVTVMREAPFFGRPSTMTYDPATNSMYVLDAVTEPYSIVEIDLDDNVRRVVATERVDESEESIEYFDGKLLLDGERLLLLDTFDNENNKLISVNIASGEVEVLASGFVHAGSLEMGPVIDGRRTVYVIGKLASENALELAVLLVDPGVATPVTVFSRPDENPANQIGGGAEVWDSPGDLVFNQASGFLYVIDQVSGGLYRINGLGNRLLVEHAGAAELNQPVAITLDPSNGVLYIVNRAGEREIISIDVDDSGVGTFESFRSNANGDVEIADPRDLILVTRGGSKFFWLPDAGISQGIVEIDLIENNESIIPARESGEGLAFDNPETLTLDAANNRLLVLSPDSIQGVNVADGHRGNFDLFTTEPLGGTTLGGLAIFDAKHWVSVNDGGNGLSTVNGLGNGDANAPSALSGVITDVDLFGDSSNLLVEDGRAYVATLVENESGTLRDRVQEITLPAEGLPSVKTVFTSNPSGGVRKHLFRYDDTHIIVGDRADAFVLQEDDDDDDELAQIRPIFPASDATVLEDVVAYGYAGQRLYMNGRVENVTAIQFGWVDLQSLPDEESALPGFHAIATTDNGDFMPGYPARIDHLSGFEVEGPRQRLFALSGAGGNRNELVVINLMDVAYDGDDEDDTFDTDPETGELLRKQTGETVLISRSDLGRDDGL